MLSDEARAVLEKTREMVATSHWRKGSYYRVVYAGTRREKKTCCLVGLINTCCGWDAGISTSSYVRAVGKGRTRKEALNACLDILQQRKCRFVYGDMLEEWNDQPSRTRDDVLALLDDALTVSDAAAVASDQSPAAQTPPAGPRAGNHA